MSNLLAILRREFAAYSASPIILAYVIVFLLSCGGMTFYPGQFYARGQADLEPFFDGLPWLYLLLMPALSMGSWAEERRHGTLELLLSLPVNRLQAVLGKYLAAWLFAGQVLLLTFPLVLTVNYLGDPDNRAILVGYLASWLLAGAYLAAGSCLSALTRSQTLAFLLALLTCLLFVICAWPTLWQLLPLSLPHGLSSVLASLSFLVRYESLSKGVLDLRDLLFFVSFIVVWLWATVMVIELKKAG